MFLVMFFKTRLRKNVLSKVVDKTDELIANAICQEEKKELKKELEQTERRRSLVESLLEFHREDQKVNTERRSQMNVDKVKEREKNLEYFDDFLRIVGDKKSKRDHQAKLHKNFWDSQAQELRQGRVDERQFDKDLLALETLKETKTEDDLVNIIKCDLYRFMQMTIKNAFFIMISIVPAKKKPAFYIDKK